MRHARRFVECMVVFQIKKQGRAGLILLSLAFVALARLLNREGFVHYRVCIVAGIAAL